MNDLIKILSNSNKDIDNQKLMDYLSGKLSGTDKHEVEQWMADNDFVNDAVEGLQSVDKEKNIDLYVAQLNKQLNHYIRQKKLRREKNKITSQQWPVIAVLVILLLAVLAYIVLRTLGG